MMAMAAVQSTVTSALASTSKKMKKEGKNLAKAEAIVDEAVEIRDVANDLTQTLSEFAQTTSGDFDDDDLEAELMAMMDTEPPDPPTGTEKLGAAEEAKRRLEQKLAEEDAARAFNTAAPEVPTSKKMKKKMEKDPLLAATSVVDAV